MRCAHWEPSQPAVHPGSHAHLNGATIANTAKQDKNSLYIGKLG
ncbi:hypothetical protein R0381_002702 [Jeongeupia wiesaeckerbachi]